MGKHIHHHPSRITKSARAARMAQQPCLLWYTGLSGAGKSTIANLVDERLYTLGRCTYVLDGDNVRHGLNKDLGFTDSDRVENVRRIAEVGKLMVDAGLIVGAAFISPFRAERRVARELFDAGEFVEVYVDAPLSVAEWRDPKGLYKRARAGEIKQFTGIDSPYEPPEDPEIWVDAAFTTAEEAADRVIGFLELRGSAGAGDTYKRREVSPGQYQCGCRWERRPGRGDVLIECALHKEATRASVDRFERERSSAK